MLSRRAAPTAIAVMSPLLLGLCLMGCAGKAGPSCPGCAADQGLADVSVDGKPPQFDGASPDADSGGADSTRDSAPDMNLGSWYPADSVDCATFCSGKGLSNVPSPDGCRCVAGEVRCASALAFGITFLYGCGNPQCPAQSNITSSSSGKYCYRPGQKHDNDKTDLTVACYCR